MDFSAFVRLYRDSAEIIQRQGRLLPMKRIPANLITGFLGTGKTTAIRALLDQRPPGERWAIFINEYGMVSMDEALLEQDGVDDVFVQELAGGCFCCETAALFKPMLVQFLKRSRPDRLLIEPSGAGHPASVLDGLRESRFFHDHLDVRATICIVDPKDFDNPSTKENPVFHDQIEMADVVVLNHVDHRDADCVARCRAWIEQFEPPKLLITETSFGKLDPAWLELDGTIVRPPKFPQAHHDHGANHEQSQSHGQHQEQAPVMVALGAPVSTEPVIQVTQTALPGQPIRLENSGQGQWACGWIFHRDECFDRYQLMDLLGSLRSIQRLKGVFHCQDDWWTINRSGNDTTFRRSAWRRDSRLEIIHNAAEIEWNQIQTELMSCRTVPLSMG